MRWGDMDAQGHVNNAAYLDYLQEARVAFLLSGATAAAQGVATLELGAASVSYEGGGGRSSVATASAVVANGS